ncbi:MAG: CHAT domain-containing protein [Lewinellaceae bacterium]|nr:CHAT domain-containing protein [Lewinellaceae bacterium]
MNKLFLPSLLFLLLSSTLFSQPSSEQQARQALQEGEELSRERKYEAANQKFEQALAFFERDFASFRPQIFQAKMGLARNCRQVLKYDQALSIYQSIIPWKASAASKKQQLELETGIGICYYKQNQPDLALRHLKKAEDAYRVDPPWEKFFPISQAYSFLGNIYRNRSMPDSAIYYYRKTVETNVNFYGTEKQAEVGLNYIVLGTAYNQNDQFREAVEYYDKGVKIILETQGPGHQDLMQGYTYLSAAYARIGELHKAEAYFKQAQAILHKHFPPGHIYQAVLCSNGGELYRMMSDYETAAELQRLALSIFEKNLPPGHLNIAVAHFNLALVLNDLKRYIEAAGHLEKCIQYVVEKHGEEHYPLALSYNGLGQAYIGLKDYPRALNALDKSLEIAERTSVRPHLNFASPNYNKGEIFLEQGKYGEAIRHYGLALEGLGYNGEAPGEVFDYKRVKTLLEILDARARAYQEQFRQTQNEESLSRSLRDYRSGMEILDHVVKSFREEDIASLAGEFYSFMESAVGAHCEAYWQTGERRYLEQAFELAERSRAVLLRKAALHNTARAYADIPEQTLAEEQEIKRRIAGLAAAVDEAVQEGKPKTDTAVLNLNARLAEEQAQLEAFLKQLEEDYPRYYRLKYDFRVLPVEEVQASLRPGQAQVAYFIGNRLRLAFVFTSDDFRAAQLPADYPLADWCRQLCQSIYGESPDAGAYVQNAHRLYQKLVQPLEPLPEQLTVIPDGPLYYLPFEVLLSNLPEQPEAFHSHPYLLHRYQMAYSFSITLTQAMVRQPAKGERMLVVAPSFGPAQETPYDNYRRDNLGPLLYNGQEAQAIRGIMGADLLAGEEASLEAFREKAAGYGIFHFATHAKADDYDSDYSYLAFAGAGQDEPNAKFYLRDLYALHLPARMVVLSACETGLGEFRRGEGVLSLARGFAYAGARSIVTSLWATNDQATARLMEAYYQHLREGKTIDGALRQAKLDYLAAATDPAEAHPFKWGAFIAIGDMDALSAGGGGLWRWVLVGSVGVLFFLLLRRRSRGG